jgi:hypothetical protein
LPLARRPALPLARRPRRASGGPAAPADAPGSGPAESSLEAHPEARAPSEKRRMNPAEHRGESSIHRRYPIWIFLSVYSQRRNEGAVSSSGSGARPRQGISWRKSRAGRSSAPSGAPRVTSCSR